ncbi:anaphase promoting complex subunit 5 [Dissophora ornata]|nr:anaphase promoting complex subunit 5 [Dissophora ornata]
MTSRRAFARTATDISLLPPRTQGFSPSEQAAAAGFAHELFTNGAETPGRGFAPTSVHVVPYLTPHKVSVLILIEYYCQNQCPLPAAQDLLLFLLKCIQDPAEYLHSNVNKFGRQVATETNPDVWGHLCITLKRIKSPHHLRDFFMDQLDLDDTDPKDVVPRKVGLKDLVVQPAEVMAQIEYRKLEFEEMCKFYNAFVTYISAIGKNDQHSQLKDRSLGSAGSTVLSAFDMEKYLDQQTQQLSNLEQADIPEDLMAHVYNIQSRMPALAKTHYIMCLHAQQTGDFEVAIQSLHRFFDYSMVMHDRVLYQYALLNLAMLHARFSHFEQALLALREAIEVARDHQDQECLGYALKTMPSSTSEAHEAQSLAGETDGQAFQYLRALSELAVAKQMQGESMHMALEALVKASSINLRHSLDGVGGAIQLFQSRIWGAYGFPSLSSLYSQLQLKYRPSESDMNDSASSYSKSASDLAVDGRFEESLRVIELARTKFPLKTMKATPWVQTLVQILQRRAMATNQLRDAEIWTQHLGVTLINTSIFGDGSSGMSSRENQLDDTSRDIQLEILLQKALLSVLAGQRLPGAQQLSEGLAIVKQNQWPGTHKFTVMYLLALAEIYLDSGSPISAIPLLFTATTLSENNMQRPLLLLVKLRLSEALLCLDSVQQAGDLVDNIMTMVLNQGDVFVQSLAYFQRAKCLLAWVNKMEPLSAAQEHVTEPSHTPITVRQYHIKRVMEHLERAFEGFKRIESLKDMAQVLYFQVRVCRELAPDQIETTLRLFKTTSLKLSSARNKHEPSWYSYYYARDVFEGILGVKDSNDSKSNDSIAQSKDGGPPKSQPHELGVQGRVGSSGGLKRVGSSQLGGLKRTPSQLWHSTVATQQRAPLPPHDERGEQGGVGEGEGDDRDGQGGEDDDDMDIDMDLDMDSGSLGDRGAHRQGRGDDTEPRAAQIKKRRV